MAKPAAVEHADDIVRLEGDPAGGEFVILCDHASNRVPPGFGDIGLSDADMQRHIAWDPGALPVARGIAERLGCPLIFPDASRLLIDCNRPVTAPDSATALSEDTEIPGNRNLPDDLRARRVAGIYEAYHGAIDALLEQRLKVETPTALVSVHSFTPVFRSAARPWHIGVLYDEDRRLAAPLLGLLEADPELVVGENKPYGPWDGVYHTLSRHGEARGVACVMIEVANDLIADEDGQAAWAERLAEALLKAGEAAA